MWRVRMKRTEVKEVEEYYCDFCGCECTDEHYDVALPFVEINGYFSRFCSNKPNSIEIKHLCLCGACTKRNAQVNTFFSNAGHNKVSMEQTVDKPYEGSYISRIGALRYQTICFSEHHKMTLEYKK